MPFLNFRALPCGCLKEAKASVLFLLVNCILFFIFFLFSHADARTISLDFQDEGLSANIKNAPMKAVIEKIVKKEDIWIKGAEKLSDEEYSVRFKGHSVREALERILSWFNYNYCLFLGRKGTVLGVIVLSRQEGKPIIQKRNIRRRIPRPIRRR
jgi:hypothetical protein